MCNIFIEQNKSNSVKTYSNKVLEFFQLFKYQSVRIFPMVIYVWQIYFHSTGLGSAPSSVTEH